MNEDEMVEIVDDVFTVFLGVNEDKGLVLIASNFNTASEVRLGKAATERLIEALRALLPRL